MPTGKVRNRISGRGPSRDGRPWCRPTTRPAWWHYWKTRFASISRRSSPSWRVKQSPGGWCAVCRQWPRSRDGAVVQLVYGLQRSQRGGAQGCPPGAQHLRGGHPERPLPGDERQVTEDRGQHPGIVRVRHQRHQDRRADRRRGRHRPPGLAFHLPFQSRLRGDLIDHPGTGQLIELLFEGAQPGVLSRMPAGLHLAVAADHRRRGRGHLHEHQLLPGPESAGCRPPPARCGRPSPPGRPARPGPPAGSRSPRHPAQPDHPDLLEWYSAARHGRTSPGAPV